VLDAVARGDGERFITCTKLALGATMASRRSRALTRLADPRQIGTEASAGVTDAWHAVQVALLLLKSAWPRRTSPAGRPC